MLSNQGVEKATETENIIHRTADDLFVLAYQKTLYILNKQKQNKELAPKEVIWLNSVATDKQTQLAVNMRFVPNAYFEDVYLYLADAAYHKSRLKVLQQAEKSKTLAPWAFHLTQGALNASETLFKPENEIMEALKNKHQKPRRVVKPVVSTLIRRKRARRLNKLSWACLTPRQKRQFRTTKKKPKLLKHKLRMFMHRRSTLKRFLFKKVAIRSPNYINLIRRPHKQQPYGFKIKLKSQLKKSRFRRVVFFGRRLGPVKYALYKQTKLLRRFATFWPKLWAYNTRNQCDHLLAIKKTHSKQVQKSLLMNLFYMDRQSLKLSKTGKSLTETLLLPSSSKSLSALDMSKKYLQSSRLLNTRPHIFVSVSNYKIRRKIRRKVRFKRIARRYFFRKVVAQGVTVLRQRMHYYQHKQRLSVFKNFFKKQFSRFRHISKNRLFISLFRAHFSSITGFKEKQLMFMWFNFRRKHTKFWGTANLVSKFSQSILLTATHLAMFFGIAPTLSAARALVNVGALIINGVPCVSSSTFARPGDTLQVTPNLWVRARRFYFYQQWSYLKLKLSRVSFFQVDWSMLLFTLVTWPKTYELVAPSYLSERWIRYYIRHFPVRNRKYQKVKMIWKAYPRPKSKHSKS